MGDPEIINPYEIEEGELPPPPADSDTSSDSEPEVKAEDEDEDEAATVGTITRAPYSMFERANAEYSMLKRLGQMDRYLGGISMERRSETREHHKLRQSVSMLEDQIRGLMLEDKEEKERLKKKLRASQQEKEKIEQAFRHVLEGNSMKGMYNAFEIKSVFDGPLNNIHSINILGKIIDVVVKCIWDLDMDFDYIE
nr:hypothetical protein [Tanacetum cinerariifolium]